MCERRSALILVLVLASIGSSARAAEPEVTLLDLPFTVAAMRGPGSEVALAVSTSGLIPIRRPKTVSADPKAASTKADETESAPVVVVWGEGGGAVLALVDGAVRTTLLGAGAVEGLAAAETPRGAIPGSHRALAGPLSAYLSGQADSSGGAASLTVRERQPMGVTADPKPVPVATQTVAPGPDAVFAARRPRIASLDGKPAILAVTALAGAAAKGSSALAAIAKGAEGRWTIIVRSPPQLGDGLGAAPLVLAAVSDFTGTGRPQIAAIRAPDGAGAVQLWSLSEGAWSLTGEAPGYAGARADEDVDLAAVITPGDAGASELVLPTGDRAALAVLAMRDGIRERARIALPAPVAFGLAALGRGDGTRILAGLADGRVAVVRPLAETRP